MDYDDFNNKIKEFDLLTKTAHDQMSEFLALLSEKKVPSGMEMDALDTNIAELQRTCNEIIALAKANFSEAEWPPEGSGINAYISAVETGRVSDKYPQITEIGKKGACSRSLPDPGEILDPVQHYKGLSPDDPAVKIQAEKIEQLLKMFGAPGAVTEIQCGPAFTQFGFEPGFVEQNGRKTRVRVRQIEALADDLRMELSANHLSIEAPISGKTYVGIQVQNKTQIPVSLREVMESDDFRNQDYELGIALGRDINGEVFSVDLACLPHLLIAGATGSGKSVCLNTILSCLLLQNSPERLKLILIDPKRTELSAYNGIPHLITPVVTDIEHVINVLNWVLRETDLREEHFMENEVCNIQEYNSKITNKQLPYIVVVIDELANLMAEDSDFIENSIVRLAQSAHKAGIYLIAATQRPSRYVVTGTIKGCMQARIAFSVATGIDSIVILDCKGAENLFGNGDMYFFSPEESSPRRMQCVRVSEGEIRRIVSFWKGRSRADNQSENREPDRVNDPLSETDKDEHFSDASVDAPPEAPLISKWEPPLKKDGDPLYDEAVKIVRKAGRASANLLLSRLGIGYKRAHKLLSRMEEDGIVSPPDANPTRPRQILDYGEYGQKKAEH